MMLMPLAFSFRRFARRQHTLSADTATPLCFTARCATDIQSEQARLHAVRHAQLCSAMARC